MATILLTWELGGGLGHMMRLRPVAYELLRRGHRVVVMLRELSRAHQVFGSTGAQIVQAPVKHQPTGQTEVLRTFAQILKNIGFADPDELMTLAQAWRNTFQSVAPDLIVADHSPTAVLAVRGLPVRRAIIGPGFACPPDISPLPDLRTWLPPDPGPSHTDETRVLHSINHVLRGWNLPVLERVTQVYHPLDETFLLTFAEFDVYLRPAGTRYWGLLPIIDIGPAPDWPKGNGARIFAYLKPFAALSHLLDSLCRLPNPALVYVDGMSPQEQAQFTRPNVVIASGAVNMRQTARECDLAILNGTHATTVSMLLAGKPILQIPLYLEQALNSLATAKLGAALVALPSKPERVVNGLHSMLTESRFATAAEVFAAQHKDHDPNRTLSELVDRVEGLATVNPG